MTYVIRMYVCMYVCMYVYIYYINGLRSTMKSSSGFVKRTQFMTACWTCIDRQATRRGAHGRFRDVSKQKTCNFVFEGMMAIRCVENEFIT